MTIGQTSAKLAADLKKRYGVRMAEFILSAALQDLLQVNGITQIHMFGAEGETVNTSTLAKINDNRERRK